MDRHRSFFSSSIGRKAIVGVTGLALIIFLIGHLLGNLQIFLGQDAINNYGVFLRSMPTLIWSARIGLIFVFVVHLIFALKLWKENREARPTAYVAEGTVKATKASRTMALTGSVVLLFVIGHLLHLTFQVILPENAHFVDAKGRHDIYTMVVLGFMNPLVTGLYVLALLMAGSHLSHGIASVFQSLGFRRFLSPAKLDCSSKGLAWLLILGYISIPLAIFTGLVGLPPGATL
jgi:succinate dehydrogenase / fumarate reductase, cytochrome b subunit